jgi:hypothetical protein
MLCSTAACVSIIANHQVASAKLIDQGWPRRLSAIERAGSTKPIQIMNALPKATVHGPASTGARISAPAKIAANQNSASVAAAIVAPLSGYRNRKNKMINPAIVAAPIEKMLLRMYCIDVNPSYRDFLTTAGSMPSQL